MSRLPLAQFTTDQLRDLLARQVGDGRDASPVACPGCGRGSRGGGTCSECLREEIGRREGRS